MSNRICRYFKKGYCKFGDRCRFLHEDNVGNNNRNSLRESDVGYLLDLMAENLSNIDNCKMWPLTAYGFVNGVHCLPGFEDISPEEVHYQFYEAYKHRTMDQFVSHMKSLLQIARNNRQMYLNKTDSAFNIIKQALNEPTASSKVPTSVITPLPSFSFKTGFNSFQTSSTSATTSFTALDNSTAMDFQQLTNDNFAALGGTAFSSSSFLGNKPPINFSFTNQSVESPFANSSIFPASNNSAAGFSFVGANSIPAGSAPPVGFSFVNNANSVPINNGAVEFAASSNSVNKFTECFNGGPNSSFPTGQFSTSVPVASFEQPDRRVLNIEGHCPYPAVKYTDTEIAAFEADKFTLKNVPKRPPPKELC